MSKSKLAKFYFDAIQIAKMGWRLIIRTLTLIRLVILNILSLDKIKLVTSFIPESGVFRDSPLVSRHDKCPFYWDMRRT